MSEFWQYFRDVLRWRLLAHTPRSRIHARHSGSLAIARLSMPVSQQAGNGHSPSGCLPVAGVAIAALRCAAARIHAGEGVCGGF